VVVTAALVTAAVEPTFVAAIVAVLLVGVLMAALEFGLGVGAVGAVAAAAASVQLCRLVGVWDATVYLPIALLPVAFVLAALIGSGLRSSVHGLGRQRPGADVAPANGSLGLLHESVAERRLDEEIERAGFTGSPLSVVWIRTRLFDDATQQPDRGRVLRVVSRTVESVMEVVHLPVAFSDADIVGILAETDEDAAERLIERIRRSCASATLLVGSDRARRRFSDLATIEAGLVSNPADGMTASTLLERARASIRGTHAAPQRPVPVGPGEESAAHHDRHVPNAMPVEAAAEDRRLVPS
jgi:hypothetical protein